MTIDSPEYTPTEIPCPTCGEHLQLFPPQRGTCIEGSFIAKIRTADLWCEECQESHETEFTACRDCLLFFNSYCDDPTVCEGHYKLKEPNNDHFRDKKMIPTFKTTPAQADAWNCTLLEMGMMPQAWVDKLETYYRISYRRTDFHDEFFATYNDMRALLKVPNRFRAYVGQLRDIGLPKRKLAVI